MMTKKEWAFQTREKRPAESHQKWLSKPKTLMQRQKSPFLQCEGPCVHLQWLVELVSVSKQWKEKTKVESLWMGQIA